MKSKQESFASLFKEFEYRYDNRTVFDDFLTMTICALSQNPSTGKSNYEDLYLQTIAKYANDKLRFNFPKLFALLVNEMDERFYGDGYNDVLGEYYEQNLYRKGTSQYFTPWPICSFMAKSSLEEAKKDNEGKPLRILDPACGSGRMLLACRVAGGTNHFFFGIDIDPMCVKMTAINLFLNGMFKSEVLCGDFLIPEDFQFSYQISFLPFGIFKIEEKEKSPLWHLLKNSLEKKPKENDIKLPSEKGGANSGEGTQLTFF